MRACGYASMHSCMMARDDSCVMPRYDVAAWESALDLILGEVELPPVPRHRGHGAHAKRPGRGTSLWTGIGDAIVPVLGEYPDQVEGLWVGEDRPDDSAKSVQQDPPGILGSLDSQPWAREDDAPVACMTSMCRTRDR